MIETIGLFVLAEVVLLCVLLLMGLRKFRRPFFKPRPKALLNMGIVTRKYVRKPLIVDAIQVTVENFEELAAWCQGTIVNNDGTEPMGEVDPSSQHIHVRVHNPRSGRQTKAFVGDWILYTERGYKIYNTKAFTGTFVPYKPS
jgi:hypothetical protein